MAPLDANRLLVLLPTIDGKQQIGNETAKQLNHEAVFASGYQVIYLQVAFPPATANMIRMPVALPSGTTGYIFLRIILVYYFSIVKYRGKRILCEI